MRACGEEDGPAAEHSSQRVHSADVDRRWRSIVFQVPGDDGSGRAKPREPFGEPPVLRENDIEAGKDRLAQARHPGPAFGRALRHSPVQKYERYLLAVRLDDKVRPDFRLGEKTKIGTP